MEPLLIFTRTFLLMAHRSTVLTSPWSWALLALAAAHLVTGLLGSSLNATSVYAVIGTLPLVVAAALMWRAPGERLVQIAAIGFAAGPVIDLLRVTVNSIVEALAASRDYARLPELLLSVTSEAAQFRWAFPIVAIVALSLYLGAVRTRVGWAIVAIGVLVALARVALTINAILPASDGLIAGPDDSQTLRLLTAPVAQLSTVAWACLLAVAFERRLWLFSVAASAALVGGFYTVLNYLGSRPRRCQTRPGSSRASTSCSRSRLAWRPGSDSLVA